MQSVACDLCGSEESIPRLRHQEWQLVRCRHCSLVYLNPRPDPEVIARDFDWFRHAPLQHSARNSAARRALRRLRQAWVRQVRKPRERIVLDRMARFVKGGRLLDVGCGTGSIAVAANEAGFESYGIDISDVAVGIARERGLDTIRKGTIHEVHYPDAHFDAILMMSVLEHEHFPSRALAQTHRLLKSGGYLFVSGGYLFVKVPNYACWNRFVSGRHWCGYYFPQHLFHYTPKTLARLVQKANLEVVRNSFWDHMPLSDVFWLTARKP